MVLEGVVDALHARRVGSGKICTLKSEGCGTQEDWATCSDVAGSVAEV